MLGLRRYFIDIALSTFPRKLECFFFLLFSQVRSSRTCLGLEYNFVKDCGTLSMFMLRKLSEASLQNPVYQNYSQFVLMHMLSYLIEGLHYAWSIISIIHAKSDVPQQYFCMLGFCLCCIIYVALYFENIQLKPK